MSYYFFASQCEMTYLTNRAARLIKRTTNNDITYKQLP